MVLDVIWTEPCSSIRRSAASTCSGMSFVSKRTKILVSTYAVTGIPYWLGTYRWVASRQARSRSSSHVAGHPAIAEPLCSARRLTIPTKSRAVGDLVTVTMPLLISKINLSRGFHPIRARIASGTVTCPFAVITGIAGTLLRHQYTICALVLLLASGIPGVALLSLRAFGF